MKNNLALPLWYAGMLGFIGTVIIAEPQHLWICGIWTIPMIAGLLMGAHDD
ncbi:hypothetical protein CARN8_1420006 [mine drainage metagenome]|uniref:Uncharacterized protein n=1 Tax=mine drainage metagenome TaxID=410659 RepID=A0A3P3ZLN3_9ZZZZ